MTLENFCKLRKGNGVRQGKKQIEILPEGFAWADGSSTLIETLERPAFDAQTIRT
jgi:hypothetical protein